MAGFIIGGAGTGSFDFGSARSSPVFRIADHVRGHLQRTVPLSGPSPPQNATSVCPLTKSQRRPFLISNFVGPDHLKNDDGPVQEAPRPRSDATKKEADV